MKIVSMILCCGLLCVGVGLTLYGGYLALQENATDSWPTTNGIITQADWNVKNIGPENFTVTPEFRYTYTVGDVDYMTTVFERVDNSRSPGEVRRLLNDHPVGSAVTVFYNPEQPGEGVFLTGVTAGSLVLVGVGAVFLAIPLLMRVLIRKFGFNTRSIPVSELSPRGRRIFWMIFPTIFLSVGVVLLLVGWSTRQQQQASTTWPSVEGTVIYAGLSVSTRDEEGREVKSYRPRVVYDYVLDDITYTAERMSFGGVSGGERADAMTVVNEHPVDSAVTVFYDPADPYEATLSTAAGSGVWVMFGVGALFALVGLGFGAGVLWRSFNKPFEEDEFESTISREAFLSREGREPEMSDFNERHQEAIERMPKWFRDAAADDEHDRDF